MSSLIFYISNTEIILAMDTLAVSDDDGTPFLFTTKFYPVPHLRGVICGTGDGQFVADWFVRVNTGMVVKDFFDLDRHTSSALLNLWLARHESLSPVSTVTIYHFGFDGNDTPCAFVYRSEQDFVSERLPINGVSTKPPTEVPTEFMLPNDFERMMLSQQKDESAKPKESRVYIGGDILVCHMTKDATVIFRAGTFPDREEARKIMFANVKG